MSQQPRNDEEKVKLMCKNWGVKKIQSFQDEDAKINDESQSDKTSTRTSNQKLTNMQIEKLWEANTSEQEQESVETTPRAKQLDIIKHTETVKMAPQSKDTFITPTKAPNLNDKETKRWAQ